MSDLPSLSLFDSFELILNPFSLKIQQRSYQYLHLIYPYPSDVGSRPHQHHPKTEDKKPNWKISKPRTRQSSISIWKTTTIQTEPTEYGGCLELGGAECGICCFFFIRHPKTYSHTHISYILKIYIEGAIETKTWWHISIIEDVILSFFFRFVWFMTQIWFFTKQKKNVKLLMDGIHLPFSHPNYDYPIACHSFSFWLDSFSITSYMNWIVNT